VTGLKKSIITGKVSVFFTVLAFILESLKLYGNNVRKFFALFSDSVAVKIFRKGN